MADQEQAATGGGAAHGVRGAATAHDRRRAALTLILVLGWIALLPLLWGAFATLPSPERLEQTRMARIPTLRGLLFLLARSGAELLAVVALTWPRARLYATRLALAVPALLAWFLYTAPMSLSRMEWLHRRWLALTLLLLLAALALEGALRLARRGRG